MAIYHTTVDAYHKWKRNGGITNHNNVVNILNSIPNRRYQCMTIGLEHVHSLSHDELGLIFDLVVILTIEYKWVPSTSLNNFQYVIISLKSDNFINSLYQGTLWTVFDLDHKKKNIWVLDGKLSSPLISGSLSGKMHQKELKNFNEPFMKNALKYIFIGFQSYWHSLLTIIAITSILKKK